MIRSVTMMMGASPVLSTQSSPLSTKELSVRFTESIPIHIKASIIKRKKKLSAAKVPEKYNVYD